MPKYDNTNQGAIWKNKKKEKQTHPDFTGQINVNGVEYWLNGWLRGADAKQDAPAMKFTVRPKTGTMPVAKTDGKNVSSRQEMDDEIPF